MSETSVLKDFALSPRANLAVITVVNKHETHSYERRSLQQQSSVRRSAIQSQFFLKTENTEKHFENIIYAPLNSFRKDLSFKIFEIGCNRPKQD